MSAQTPYALTIPEILCEVFDHLEFDKGALFAACQVNKIWAETSLNVLWRSHRLRGMERLASLTESRRQFYADKIRSLPVERCPIEYRHSIETLNFPRLKKLGFALTENNENCYHHLVPTLEEFKIAVILGEFRIVARASQPEDYLRQLPERCPDLRKLCVLKSRIPIDFSRLKDYLKKFSKLRSIDLGGMSDSAMTNEVVFYLGGLPLSELHMNKLITSEMVDLTDGKIHGRLFSNAVRLGLRMEWRAATTLVPAFTNLRELKLELVSADTSHETFQAIGTLSQLRGLDLTTVSVSGRDLSRDELLAIGKLHELRNLAISTHGTLTLDNSVTDDDLVSFLSSFPEAESIRVHASRVKAIPSSATIALATTSTRLRHYRFDAIWDSDFIQSYTPPLFPRLDDLCCNGLRCTDMPTEG
jgi:hypothetical protein